MSQAQGHLTFDEGWVTYWIHYLCSLFRSLPSPASSGRAWQWRSVGHSLLCQGFSRLWAVGFGAWGHSCRIGSSPS